MESQTNQSTTEEELNQIFTNLKRAYNKNRYPSREQRKEVLLTLKESIIAHENEFYQALNADYGFRSEFDTFASDILPSVMGINYSLKRLCKWMKPSRRHAGLFLFPTKIEVQYQPLGIVGVISPWNYPLFLCLSPATQAIAAGNRVMIKTSEFTPNTNKVLIKATECIREHLAIVEGEAETGSLFSALPFDHLLFTGSSAVGRYVAQAAAKNLTPITLELGGKSPVIVAEDANWNSAIDSIIFGKTLNSGQVCVSPDYVFVKRGKEETFIESFKVRYLEYFDKPKKKDNNLQTHIIDQKQYQRLQGLLKDATEKGAEIHKTKELDSKIGSENTLLCPHLVTNVNDDMDLMREEIFGSILPILSYDSIDECIDYINSRPRPLALYLMSANKDLINKMLRQTHSGAVCVNDTVMQVAAEDAPFGGVGESGLGHYHGIEGFKQLSKAKTVLKLKAWLPKNRVLLKYRVLLMKFLKWFFFR